jgi:thiol-disulfide isomerase/thioredoxin
MAEYNTLVSILKTPYVIEYTGDWCYLCKSQNTMLEEVEKEFDGEWALIKIDVD